MKPIGDRSPLPAFDWLTLFAPSEACEERMRNRDAALIAHVGIVVALREARDWQQLNRRALVAMQWVGFTPLEDHQRRDIAAAVIAGMQAWQFKTRRQGVAA
jgi:hypothetical protein